MLATIDFRLGNLLVIFAVLTISAFLSGYGWSILLARDEERTIIGFVFIILGSSGMIVAVLMYRALNHIAW